MTRPAQPEANAGEEATRQRTDLAIQARIARAVSRARLALFFETLWPRLLPLLLIAALFLMLSWFGLWRAVPDIARFLLLAGFVVVAAGAALFAARVRVPDRTEALARVERATGTPHRPATAYNDKLASAPDEPAARALWAAHRRRILASLDRLRAGWPMPGVARRDPFAFRFLAVLLLAVAFLFAGRERFERVVEAFQGPAPAAAIAARIDAWATPPAYTGRPPIFLTGERGRASGSTIRVPEGSTVTVRVAGRLDIAVVSADATGTETDVPALTPVSGTMTPDGPVDGPTEYRVELATSGSVAVRRGGTDVHSWNFSVDPDMAPQIAFEGTPGATQTGSFRLAYKMSDDYGVTQAEGQVEAPAQDGKVVPRPLYPAPKIPLTLPQQRARSGPGETIRNLSADPWAGGPVRMRLAARDESGQTGESETLDISLPARLFIDPLARALVEQRRKLALDANQAGSVAVALDALTIAPDKYIDDMGTYLAIRSVYRRLGLSRDDDGLRNVVEELWNIALGIEDGDLSEVARNLREVQEALREALENNASDEEIKRLTEELRQAMQRFMQALAEEARRNPNMSRLPLPPNTRMLRQQDLERMLDQIERLAEMGSRDAAQQLLSELQSMLDNLRAGRPQQSEEAGQMGQMLNELGDMIRRQQELMDQTYQLDRSQWPDPGAGGRGEGPPDGVDKNAPLSQEMAELMRRLQRDQQSLQEQLQQMMRQLEAMGLGENGQFGRADQSMGQAGQNLGQGEPGNAVGDQGNALEALRQGAQSLSQQMAGQRGMQPGGQYGRQGSRGGGDDTDPLGRPRAETGSDPGGSKNLVPKDGEFDLQQARKILDAIRKRLGETDRPLQELEYLERLLQRY
jgi:uncharacterized protein (TIGR02302 family)